MKQIDEIRDLKSKGLTNIEISEKLNIPYNTVKSYLRRTGEVEVPHDYNHCKCCGKKLEMVPGKKDKIFCSSYCRVKYWRAKHNGKS